MKSNMVYFSSFSGLYNDNPKYISEQLHKNYPHVRIVWVIAERANSSEVPDYVVRVRPNTIKQVYYKNRSKTIIDNGAGLLYVFKPKNNLKMLFLKKKGQLDYSTWHGTPLKKIGNGIKHNYGLYFYSTSTKFVLNSLYIQEIFKKSFSDKIPSILLGSPRNDLLFESSQNRLTAIKRYLGLPEDKKIVLYAPTYRADNNNVDGNAFSVYIKKQDVIKCLDTLKERFEGDWVFVYRVHQFVMKVMLNDFDEQIVYNGNKHDDMAEYLTVSDVLITDYSGSLFDFTLTKRPCFLYTPDLREYGGSRGFYLPIEELPYPKAETISALIENIQSFKQEEMLKEIKRFNQSQGIVDDGHASERIVELIAKEAKFL